MSVSSYVRMRCSLEDAMARYGEWLDAEELAPPRLVREREATDGALSDGEWLGLAVFVYNSGPWTVFEEISGGLASRSLEAWIKLAAGGDLVYAGYNDAVPYAEILVVTQGRLVRRVLRDEQDSSEDVDIGERLGGEDQNLENWMDVMRWVEEDQAKLTRPSQGWLWIHRSDSDSY